MELKSCPFCGTKAKLLRGDLGGRWVRCQNNDCGASTVVLYSTGDKPLTLERAEELVQTKWNRRADSAGEKQ